MKKLLIVVGVVLSTLLLFSWSPWLTKKYAEERVIDFFEVEWGDTADGCGLTCDGCGVTEAKKALSGYIIKLQFKCGLKDYFVEEIYLVTPIGSVHSGF